MLIRLAKSTDLPLLAKIYPQAYNPLQLGETWFSSAATEMFNWYFERYPQLFFVAELNDKLVGAIMALAKPWHDGMHLVDLEIFVDPAAQAHGVGSALIKRLLQAGQDHFATVACDGFTHIVKEHPLKWYKAIGFETLDQFVVMSGATDTLLANLISQ